MKEVWSLFVYFSAGTIGKNETISRINKTSIFIFYLVDDLQLLQRRNSEQNKEFQSKFSKEQEKELDGY